MMSQYNPPNPGVTDREILLQVHYSQFMLTERLFGNGQPGEIDTIHGRVSHVRDSVSSLQSWRDKQSGMSATIREWLLPMVAVIVAAWAAWSASAAAAATAMRVK